MTISTHAEQQLTQRWPQWNKQILNTLIKKKIGWQQSNGETHLYLGTGFDLFEGSTSQSHRTKYKKRHLFAVIKNNVLITVVFHTISSLKTRTETAIQIWNDVIKEGYTTIQLSDAIVHIDISDPLSIRQERAIQLPKLQFNIVALH